VSARSVRIRTSSVEATRDAAAALAELARPGDLLLLVGDLGTGKTAFCQGFGRGLGVDEQITSPTFALVQSYTGRLDLNHLDVYRLTSVSEALDLGLNELLDDGGVTLIEWGDTIAGALSADFLEVHLNVDAGPEERSIDLIAVGPAWSARVRSVQTALSEWIDVGTDTASGTGTGTEADGSC
jgi:tRNA threonylcarbamoyladenosine biosynthesis protein TsaE